MTCCKQYFSDLILRAFGSTSITHMIVQYDDKWGVGEAMGFPVTLLSPTSIWRDTPIERETKPKSVPSHYTSYAVLVIRDSSGA
jgi:hypothetical protein